MPVTGMCASQFMVATDLDSDNAVSATLAPGFHGFPAKVAEPSHERVAGICVHRGAGPPDRPACPAWTADDPVRM